MEELTPKNDGNGYEQASASGGAPPLISNGREMVSISIPQRRIQKVPALLRRDEHNNRDYDPAVVSIGPYHHGKAELKLVEVFKPMALELFAAGSGKDTEFFYNKVLEVIHDVRRCYVENSTDEYDDAVFARMMLHDACIIINHINLEGKFDMKLFKVTVDHLGALAVNIINRDMSLLENQIPLWFLKLLIHLRFGKYEGEEMLSLGLNRILFREHKQTGESNEDQQEEPLHLLEACRRILVADCRKDDETNGWSTLEWLSLQSARIGEACQRHCLSKFQWLWKREKINHGFSVRKYFYSFRSVTDLKAKGIHFRPSPSYSLKDMKFESSHFYGKLELPYLVFTRNTKVFFLNMVAFEMCPNTYTDYTVSSYISFMKSLIESPNDVKELREKKIIFNDIGSDEEVLQVYKYINTYAVGNVDLFQKVIEKIQEHYNSKAKTWVAELINTYFRSPWTAIALLAAVFLLCLTFLQTYFSIYSK